jgi:hypothetical protein
MMARVITAASLLASLLAGPALAMTGAGCGESGCSLDAAPCAVTSSDDCARQSSMPPGPSCCIARGAESNRAVVPEQGNNSPVNPLSALPVATTPVSHAVFVRQPMRTLPFGAAGPPLYLRVRALLI